jgi:hypothetical protein
MRLAAAEPSCHASTAIESDPINGSIIVSGLTAVGNTQIIRSGHTAVRSTAVRGIGHTAHQSSQSTRGGATDAGSPNSHGIVTRRVLIELE